ncbi:hypothetical protein SAMN05421790_10520 [Kroppenstedtia eburnea]|uniref:Uncharacterized protein n=1 Tax=Kroppenstedtia eburnea TaxID=714067 RepID=A0A1N7LW16_9BACL|nr:hypothetical protein SAMN05421790_10520 [Kroppenstedtia eburnea]
MSQTGMIAWFSHFIPAMKVRIAFYMQDDWLAQPHMLSTFQRATKLSVTIERTFVNDFSEFVVLSILARGTLNDARFHPNPKGLGFLARLL